MAAENGLTLNNFLPSSPRTEPKNQEIPGYALSPITDHGFLDDGERIGRIIRFLPVLILKSGILNKLGINSAPLERFTELAKKGLYVWISLNIVPDVVHFSKPLRGEQMWDDKTSNLKRSQEVAYFGLDILIVGLTAHEVLGTPLPSPVGYERAMNTLWAYGKGMSIFSVVILHTYRGDLENKNPEEVVTEVERKSRADTTTMLDYPYMVAGIYGDETLEAFFGTLTAAILWRQNDLREPKVEVETAQPTQTEPEGK